MSTAAIKSVGHEKSAPAMTAGKGFPLLRSVPRHRKTAMNIRNERGAALVEAALVLPVLILIVFGITEFGRAMFITNTLNNVAREGARRAAVSSPLNASALETELQNTFPLDKADLNIKIELVTPTSVQATVTQAFHPVVPGLLPMIDGIVLKGNASMRYEM